MIKVWFVFGSILFPLSTAQDGSGSGIAIDNVELGEDMLLQLKKVKNCFYSSSSDFEDNDMLLQLKKVKKNKFVFFL